VKLKNKFDEIVAFAEVENFRYAGKALFIWNVRLLLQWQRSI